MGSNMEYFFNISVYNHLTVDGFSSVNFDGKNSKWWWNPRQTLGSKPSMLQAGTTWRFQSLTGLIICGNYKTSQGLKHQNLGSAAGLYICVQMPLQIKWVRLIFNQIDIWKLHGWPMTPVVTLFSRDYRRFLVINPLRSRTKNRLERRIQYPS